MRKTVIYIRKSLSSEKQKHSLDVQKSICLEYAKNKQWIIQEIYDEGVMSARKTKVEERPVLNRLLNDVKEGKIGRVIVFKRDRLARNVQQYIQVVRVLQKENVEVHFTADNEPPMFTGVASEFIEVILAGIAQHEADNIVRRLIQSKKQVMRDGKWAAGSPPFAYIKGDEAGKLIIDKSKEPIVKKVYEEFLRVAPSKKQFGEITKEIRKDPLLEKLTNEQIWKIISQPLHKGLMVQKLDNEPITRENTDLAILKKDEEVDGWEKANKFLATLVPPKSIKVEGSEDEPEIEIIPLLPHLIHCDKCNQPLKVIKKVYKCPICSKQVKIAKLDEEVIQKVLNHLKRKGAEEWEKVKMYLKNRYTRPFQVMIDDYEYKINELEEEIKMNFKDYIEESTNESKVHSLIKDYQEQSKLLEKIKATHHHVNEYLDNLDKNTVDSFTVEKLTLLQKQHLIKLVSRVNVTGSKIQRIAVHAVKGV